LTLFPEGTIVFRRIVWGYGAVPDPAKSMKQFQLRQLLESVGWLSVAMASFQAFLRLDGPRYVTVAGRVRDGGLLLLVLWLVAGVASGNVIAALFGRRTAWSIVGVCWVFFLILLWDYWSYF
jgi:hypothetical protein